MPQFDIFIDIAANQAVTGLSNPTVAPLPPFVQGDTPTFRIWPLLRNATFPMSPYSLLSIAGLTLQVSLGSQVGSGGTIYTQQLAWVPSADPNNPNYWTANFPMNTAAVNTLLAAMASALAVFEVKYVSAGVPSTILQQAVSIKAAVLQAGAPVVPAGFNPASVEFCNATFLTRLISGNVVWLNPNTGKQYAVYPGDDGSLHCDPMN
jgi:hypothetical protein